MSYTSHSKTVNALCEKHPHIEECWSEDSGDEGMSYWVVCRLGFISSESECPTIHEPTVKEIREGISSIVSIEDWEKRTGFKYTGDRG